MRKNPHNEEDSKYKQTPKSLCRTSLARSAKISQSLSPNRNLISNDNPEISDKISSDSLSSDGNDNMTTKSNNQTASPHLSSLKRNQNNVGLQNSNFLQHISHSPVISKYSSLKQNNEIVKPIVDPIDSIPNNQEFIFSQNDNEDNKEIPVEKEIKSDSNNDAISNDDDSDSFDEDDGLVRTQVSRNDPIQTDENFWTQDSQNNNNNNDSSAEQIGADENDDKIETEMTHEYDESSSGDIVEEGSQNFSNPNFGNNFFLQSDNISEHESDGQFDSNEEIDSTVLSQFFKQQKIVFEFIDDETNELDKWDFEYMRVIYAKTIESEIEELNEDSYRILVRKSDTQHIKKQGDNFVMGVPYYIYSNLGKIYIIAPKVSDKL